MGGKGNIGTGGSSPGSGRRDINNYGNSGIDDALDDVAHRRIQATGSVHLNDNRAGIGLFGLFNAASDVIGQDRVNGALHRQHINSGASGLGTGSKRNRQQ